MTDHKQTDEQPRGGGGDDHQPYVRAVEREDGRADGQGDAHRRGARRGARRRQRLRRDEGRPDGGGDLPGDGDGAGDPAPLPRHGARAEHRPHHRLGGRGADRRGDLHHPRLLADRGLEGVFLPRELADHARRRFSRRAVRDLPPPGAGQGQGPALPRERRLRRADQGRPGGPERRQAGLRRHGPVGPGRAVQERHRDQGDQGVQPGLHQVPRLLLAGGQGSEPLGRPRVVQPVGLADADGRRLHHRSRAGRPELRRRPALLGPVRAAAGLPSSGRTSGAFAVPTARRPAQGRPGPTWRRRSGIHRPADRGRRHARRRGLHAVEHARKNLLGRRSSAASPTCGRPPEPRPSGRVDKDLNFKFVACCDRHARSS